MTGMPRVAGFSLRARHRSVPDISGIITSVTTSPGADS